MWPRPKLWDGRWQRAAIPTVTKHLDGDVGSTWQEKTFWGTLSLPNYPVWATQCCWPIAGSHWCLKAYMMRKRENLMENTTCQHFKVSQSEINGWDSGFQPRFTPKSEYLFPSVSQTSYLFSSQNRYLLSGFTVCFSEAGQHQLLGARSEDIPFFQVCTPSLCFPTCPSQGLPLFSLCIGMKHPINL